MLLSYMTSLSEMSFSSLNSNAMAMISESARLTSSIASVARIAT